MWIWRKVWGWSGISASAGVGGCIDRVVAWRIAFDWFRRPISAHPVRRRPATSSHAPVRGLYVMRSRKRMTWTSRILPYLSSALLAVAGLAFHSSPNVQEPPSTAAVPADMKPFTQTIPGSLVEFEMLPVPGGEGVAPFYLGRHEVTWDEFAYWAYVRDMEKEIDKIKARSKKLRPSPPYDEVDRGFGFKDRPALGM